MASLGLRFAGALRALLAGEMAHELAGNARDAEEAFLGAMFYNLGPLLAEYYFPDEAETVREEIARVVPFYDGCQHLKETHDAIQYG